MELGIKGHPTRGDEVIKILEMLGGKNCCYRLTGYNDKCFYYISYEYKYICNSYIGPDEIKGYKIFSLEDFLEKYPYKVGDKVNIYVQNDDIEGWFDMEVAEITSMRWDPARCRIVYKMKDIDEEFYADDIKDKVEEENKPEPKFKVGDTVYSTTWQQDVIIQEIFPDGFYKVSDLQCSGWFKTHEDALRKEKITLPIDSHLLTKQFKQEILLPEGYQFVDDNGNIINTKKILLVKNSPYYPTTYVDCCKVIGCRAIMGFTGLDDEEENLYGKFIALKRCRDAYWKIAGELMGLGKPWEPDWTNENQPKYGLYNELKYSIINPSQFVFPTIEMREEFHDNFKDLIETCKVLL